MMRMDPMSGEEMEMMGEDQEAVEWRRLEQHSSVRGIVSPKNLPGFSINTLLERVGSSVAVV